MFYDVVSPAAPASPPLAGSSQPQMLAQRVELAVTFMRRFWGLQFRASLPAGHALLLAPCNSVHTFWMRFPIDVLFLSPQGQVLHAIRDLRPWRACRPVRGAAAVLELTAGQLPAELPQRVQLAPPPGARIPRRLQGLIGPYDRENR